MYKYIVILLLFVSTVYGQSLDQTHIDYYNPLLNGIACNTATLNAAITAIGTKQKTMYLTATDRNKVDCTWAITSNLTIPSNIRLLIPFGVRGNVATGVTLTLEGCLVADDPNWNEGTGAVIENTSCISAENMLGSQWFSYVYDDCLHSTSVGVTATIQSCTAFILVDGPAFTKLNITNPVSITYDSTDGKYWLIVTEEDPAGWTCNNTNYCWIRSDTRPTIPPRSMLIMQSLIASNAITEAGDASIRVFNRPVTFTAGMTTSESALWVFMPGGSLNYTGVNITHRGHVTSTTNGIFKSGGTGKMKFGPAIVADPVWFISSGVGSETDPYTSIDNCGGLCEVLDSLQLHGKLRASGGFYRFASTIPATIDVPVTSGDGNIVLDFTDSIYQSTITGTIIKLNKNGVLSDVSTNLNTVHIKGGLFTTQLYGVKQNDAPIIGTAIDANRVRNITISSMKFLGFQVAILGNVADTLTVRENFFRRVKTAVFFEDNAMVDVPQDLYIHGNTASITNQPIEDGGNTDLNGSAFVRADNRVVKLHIYDNGIANSTENSWFVKMNTGDATGNSTFISINNNATEQFSQGSKVIEIDRALTTEMENLIIEGNQLGGSLTNLTAPPYSNGQPTVDVEYVTGIFRFIGNECTNTAVTCLRLDNYRGGDATGTGTVSASGLIENNVMRQVIDNNGKPFNITNVISSQTSLRIGHNAMHPFYEANMGAAAFVYPDTNVHFVTVPSYTANRVAATTMTFSPWDNYIEINGTTIITDVTPTWDGHRICMLFETTEGGVNRSATLLIETDFRARVPNESILCIRYDGKANLWKEASRTNEQHLANMTVGSNATIPGYGVLVNVPDGAATVNTITVNRNSQVVILQCQGTAGPTFVDSASLRLNGDFVCNNASATLTLVPNNSVWFEVTRSATN